MGTSVVTSKVGLPKVITISPVFMVHNQTRVSYTLYYMQAHSSDCIL